MAGIEPNTTFGRLTTLAPVRKRTDRKNLFWACRCACGSECVIRADHLRSGASTTCGCLNRITPEDLVGLTFGRLTVLRKLPRTLWQCRCACGATLAVLRSNLVTSHTRSCRCLQRELQTSHGHAGTLLYRSWVSMIQRCHNPKSREFRLYGGRGIQVCDEWRATFGNFLRDVGERPSPFHSLDRFPDMNGNYEPGNVRWASATEQCRNTSRNVWVTWNEQTYCIAEWAERVGIKQGTLRHRLQRGWPVEKAMTERPRRR